QTETPGPDWTDVTETPGPDWTDVTETPGPDWTDVTETPGPDWTDVTETPGPNWTDVTETPGPDRTDVTETPGPDWTAVTETPVPDRAVAFCPITLQLVLAGAHVLGERAQLLRVEGEALGQHVQQVAGGQGHAVPLPLLPLQVIVRHLRRLGRHLARLLLLPLRLHPPKFRHHKVHSLLLWHVAMN
ncbi:hypothetical protein ANANG_G00210990, partial [Anguilla anguilla]